MKCPHCDRLLYSRMQPKCGHCGGVLPEDCRLPEEEISQLREEQEEIAARMAAAKEREAEEREAKRKRDQSGSSSINFPFD